MNEGRRWKSKLWSEQGRAELEKLAWAQLLNSRRSADDIGILENWVFNIAARQVCNQGRECPCGHEADED
jgi:hypothetical protein